MLLEASKEGVLLKNECLVNFHDFVVQDMTAIKTSLSHVNELRVSSVTYPKRGILTKKHWCLIFMINGHQELREEFTLKDLINANVTSACP